MSCQFFFLQFFFHMIHFAGKSAEKAAFLSVNAKCGIFFLHSCFLALDKSGHKRNNEKHQRQRCLN